MLRGALKIGWLFSTAVNVGNVAVGNVAMLCRVVHTHIGVQVGDWLSQSLEWWPSGWEEAGRCSPHGEQLAVSKLPAVVELLECTCRASCLCSMQSAGKDRRAGYCVAHIGGLASVASVVGGHREEHRSAVADSSPGRSRRVMRCPSAWPVVRGCHVRRSGLWSLQAAGVAGFPTLL